MRQHGKYTRLGKRLAELGSQCRLAEALKLSQQTVSKKLRGEVPITVRELDTVGKYFGHPIHWFFEEMGPDERPSERE